MQWQCRLHTPGEQSLIRGVSDGFPDSFSERHPNLLSSLGFETHPVFEAYNSLKIEFIYKR